MKRTIKQHMIAEQAGAIARARLKKLAGVLTEGVASSFITENTGLTVGQLNGRLPSRGYLGWWSSDRDGMFYIPDISSVGELNQLIDTRMDPAIIDVYKEHDDGDGFEPVTVEDLAQAGDMANSQIQVLTSAQFIEWLNSWTRTNLVDDYDETDWDD